MKRQLIPNGHRRAKWHDYRSQCIYMITLNASHGTPPLATLAGIPGDHYNPPRTILTPLGQLVHERISAIKGAFPFTSILRRVIMPEHVHFVIYVKVAGKCHLGDIILHLKRECTIGWSPEEKRPLFDYTYHDRILHKKGQLDRMKKYVSDNPRRRLLRMLHPDFHHRSKLTTPDGTTYETYGNLTLLHDPDIEAVKISRSFTDEELRRRKIIWLHTVQDGGVLVSPFISQAERSVRDWAIDNGGRIILIRDNGFGTIFSPKGKYHDLCSEGRLLIVAPLQHSTSAVNLSRTQCQAMNHLAEQIAAGEWM